MTDKGHSDFVTETLSIKVPVQTKIRLKSIARRRHSTPSALLREALDLVLAGQKADGRPTAGCTLQSP
jgi:predicted transcriptional regulator